VTLSFWLSLVASIGCVILLAIELAAGTLDASRILVYGFILIGSGGTTVREWMRRASSTT
jgi:hypothetical protein